MNEFSSYALALFLSCVLLILYMALPAVWTHLPMPYVPVLLIVLFIGVFPSGMAAAASFVLGLVLDVATMATLGQHALFFTTFWMVWSLYGKQLSYRDFFVYWAGFAYICLFATFLIMCLAFYNGFMPLGKILMMLAATVLCYPLVTATVYAIKPAEKKALGLN